MNPVITVNDYETCVKLFVKEGDAFADRVDNKTFNDMTRGGTFGVGGISGEMWTEQRRVSLKILRDFGLGKNQMQDRVIIVNIAYNSI